LSLPVPNKKPVPNAIPITKSNQQTQISPVKTISKPGKNTISSIIGFLKSVDNRQVREINPGFRMVTPVLQHIIRNDKCYQEIRHFLIGFRYWQEY
jgi:hypothetical protein